MAVNQSNIRLTGGCIDLLSDIGSAIHDNTLRRAVEHAALDNRTLIEEDDIRAALREALEDTATHIQSADAGQEHISC